MIKAVLLKPLDGDPEGTEREFDQADFDFLVKMNAVRRADGNNVQHADELRLDGPTVAEFVARGYKASAYPPSGYAARSTPEEIATAVAAEGAGDDASQPEEKAAPAVENKMAPDVANKDVVASTTKRRNR
ncbi:hypothetical protein [Rhizobium sp. CC-YZS058]|uniref:hypothetical protein n=1 Tax=Rhizobium sp. CC-YZS058 TaxID=3042153 RepID=UPI002B0520D4|nr:hypothetical protein [Rhizobium sp. CC-YZS058]MEA3534277.1 hypothetical protein [Rhizobium sp. CC-YZS058]